jgi:hypothetical protein
MRIEIPKITKKIELREYAEEFGEAVIYVWVNPPRGILNKSANEQETLERISELWSQGPAGTEMSIEEVKILVEESARTDPRLWAWLMQKTRELIMEHRIKKKENSA